MTQAEEPAEFLGLAADIAAAYVTKNSVQSGDLPKLIAELYSALTRIGGPLPLPPAATPKPAVPVRKSVMEDYIVCLEDGEKFKSLKRHLRTHYDMSPEDYRAKWGLSPDYPMVAASYARARSQLAKAMGLGHRRRRQA